MDRKTAQELLKKVQNDYSQIAEDFSRTRQYQWKESENFRKYIKEGQTIVDAGCGNGRLLNDLLPKIKYIGIDNNETLINEAKKVHPFETFMNGDILNIPIKNEISDITFCIAALHHIPSLELRKKAILELKRITKKQGYIMLTVWNLWQKKYWKNIMKALFDFIIQRKYDWNDLFIPWADKIDRYYHAFTTSEFEKLIKSEFEIVKFFKSDHNFCAVCRKK